MVFSSLPVAKRPNITSLKEIHDICTSIQRFGTTKSARKVICTDILGIWYLSSVTVPDSTTRTGTKSSCLSVFRLPPPASFDHTSPLFYTTTTTTSSYPRSASNKMAYAATFSGSDLLEGFWFFPRLKEDRSSEKQPLSIHSYLITSRMNLPLSLIYYKGIPGRKNYDRKSCNHRR